VNKDLKNIIGDIKFNDGLTQTEIAQKIGVSSTYLSDMVNERVPITSSILGKIYELFPYTKKLPDDEIEEIKAKFEEMKKRVEELEYTIELQKRLLDQK
jgi:transcriptional regulator with XRE-family HTH domain